MRPMGRAALRLGQARSNPRVEILRAVARQAAKGLKDRAAADTGKLVERRDRRRQAARFQVLTGFLTAQIFFRMHLSLAALRLQRWEKWPSAIPEASRHSRQ